MTSPAERASGDATQASQVTKPLRELTALVLLGANAVLLFVGLIRLLVPADGFGTFTDRAGSTFFAFVGVESTVLPLLAVLLATHLRPVVPKARLITQVALGEYTAGALFGALTFLIWLVGRLAEGELLDALLGMLTRVAWLAVFAVAGYLVNRIWRTLYHTPKPKPQAGVYGQPQQGWPQQHGGYPAPGQPGGYPPPGQPGGYPPPGQGGYPAAGGYPPPGQYGQPNPPYGNAPQSAPPYGDPHAAPPFGQPPSADPTQAVPRQPADYGYPTPHDDDRTRRFHRDDPNYPR
ncbi:hypothetical protein GA0070624_1788 [Micromonospora rhizosphaerae]|uniref:Uncharacterized protein n=1 Tax=Micromonospora rhizosphaerae TaxID=568872 RepID=A0A1C6RQV9_9ACTN|nr:hypothetical protein [Micromonospora rhizosphaerae]SCL19566.1 hypothetical protein GA0070624_1788 [Micromonospora rhizosphaerae]